MPLELFRGLKPTPKKNDLVFLHGKGDPFTHPDFFEFARFAQSLGCQVGTTTNGMPLKEESRRRLIEARLDILTLSLTDIYQIIDQIRRSTSLKQVLNALGMLRRMAKETGQKLPAIHIAYLLLRSQMDNLQKLPPFFAELGIVQVVISTLDFVAAPELANKPLCTTNYDRIRNTL